MSEQQIQNPSNEQILAENGVVANVPSNGEQGGLQSGAGNAEPAQLQREYVVQTETGQVYKGKTQAEVIDQLKKAVEEGTKTIAQFNKEKKAIVEQPKPAEPTFDQNKYWELMGNNPLEAQKYAREFDPDYKRTVQELEEIRVQRVIDSFKAAHDDLPLDDDSTTKFEQLYNKFNLPLSKENLELVWAYAVQSGQLKPVSQQQAATSTTPTPPPTLDGGMSLGNGGGIDPKTMPMDQLEAMLRGGGQ